MHTFAELEAEFGLKRYLSSPLGTLYFTPAGTAAPRIMVRRFDSELDPTFVPAYVGLVRAVKDWIEVHGLDAYVQLEAPWEAGEDFVIRKNHTYYYSTRTYTDPDFIDDAPEELEQMRTAVRAALTQSPDPKDRILEAVIGRSLLEPSGKTYFDENATKFVMVEPVLLAQDVIKWSQLPNQ